MLSEDKTQNTVSKVPKLKLKCVLTEASSVRWCRCDGRSVLNVSRCLLAGKNSPSSPAVRDLLDRHQASLGRSQSFSHQQPSRSHIMRYDTHLLCLSSVQHHMKSVPVWRLLQRLLLLPVSGGCTATILRGLTYPKSLWFLMFPYKLNDGAVYTSRADLTSWFIVLVTWQKMNYFDDICHFSYKNINYISHQK